MRKRRGSGAGGWIGIAVVLLAVLLPAAPAHGQDLWEIFLTNTDGMGIPDLTVTGSSLPDLLEDLVNGTGAFSSYSGAAFSADISFAGIANVINVTVDPTTQTATLTFTILGASAQTFVFNGADLFAQLEQFIQDNLAEQITAFLSEINKLSLVAVTDGAPLSTTALSDTYVFDRFGLHEDLTRQERIQLATRGFEPGLRGRIDGYYDSISTDVGDGQSIAMVLSLEYALNEMSSIAFLAPITYTEVEGSDIVNAQGTVAAPFSVLRAGDDGPIGLQLVPYGTLAGSGSIDLVAGGLIGSFGLLGTVTADFDAVTLSFSSQFSYHDSITLRYEDYEFDPGISQEIFKAGAKATFRHGDSVYLYSSAIYTAFVQDAAVQSYWTAGFGIGVRTPSNFSMTFGYSGDFADGYRSDGFRAMVVLPF